MRVYNIYYIYSIHKSVKYFSNHVLDYLINIFKGVIQTLSRNNESSQFETVRNIYVYIYISITDPIIFPHKDGKTGRSELITGV